MTAGEKPDKSIPPEARAADRFYEGIWRILVNAFRVPRQPPDLPVAPGEECEAFRPAPGFLGYLKFKFWIVLIIFDLLILVGWIILTVAIWWLGLLLLPIAVLLAVVPDLVAYVALHLRYDTTWYVMTRRSLRIRRGIWTIHETTITFENVQNVKVIQGPLQRHFGISSLVVETAGAGAQAPGQGIYVTNLGVIEGVADAQRIRDTILPRIRQSRSAGLGDEAEDLTTGPVWTEEHTAVLREIRDAIGEL